MHRVFRSQPHFPISDFDEMCRCARSIQCLAGVSFLLFYLQGTQVENALRVSSAAVSGVVSSFPTEFTWLSVFPSSTQSTRAFFFFFCLSISSGAHNHALSCSFLIACKIWFYCWCGVAENIMFMCALAIRFFLFSTADKYRRNRQCRAAQFTVSPELENVDASSVETV